MNQQEQKSLVLLYSLIELGGGDQRRNVLKHIQQNGYWYKNDHNDVFRMTRHEKTWRNEFSYERQSLVEQGYMRPNLQGIWKITENGKNYVDYLIEKMKNMSLDSTTYFTAVFYQKLFYSQMYSEFAADQVLLEQVSQVEDRQDETSITLLNEPIAKGPVSNRSGSKSIYLRNPLLARRALHRAGHLCEIDPNHTSFLRKNSSHLYMEPHHLIPMSMTDYFNVSLDREQNIFSLCSNCHNQIHYGTKEDVQQLLSKLFYSRKEEVCAILGRNITLEELYQIYKVL